jgi:hypothetical protein
VRSENKKRRKMERRRLRKDKKAVNQRFRRDIRNTNNIDDGQYINWKDFEGTISSELARRYRFIKYDDDREFTFCSKRAFWTIEEEGVPITCKLEKNRKTAKEIGQHTFDCVMVRALYVVEKYRGIGEQSRILTEIKDISDELGIPFLCVADPFRIVGKKSKSNALVCLSSFLTDDGYETYKEKDIIKKQADRFRRLGMTNIDWSLHAQLTDRDSHYIYVPENAPEYQKQIVKSLEDGWNEDKVA